MSGQPLRGTKWVFKHVKYEKSINGESSFISNNYKILITTKYSNIHSIGP